MKILILYRPDSEHGRTVEEFIHNFQALHADRRMEVLNVDSREGSALVSLYDIMRYPAILALRDDGSVQNLWEGDELPLLDEVAGYVQDGM